MTGNLVKLNVTLTDDSKWYTYGDWSELKERFHNYKLEKANPDTLEVTHSTMLGIKRSVLFSEIYQIEAEL